MNINEHNIKYYNVLGWGICAQYSDDTLTVCRYGKTKSEAKERLIERVVSYYK